MGIDVVQIWKKKVEFNFFYFFKETYHMSTKVSYDICGVSIPNNFWQLQDKKEELIPSRLNASS